MPDYKVGPVVHDDPRRIEKLKLKVSSEAKSKGKAHLKDPVTGYTPSDDQMLFAEVVGASILPSVHIIPTPAPRTQGIEGSCASWTVGYLVRSVEHYHATSASSYNDATNTFSPEYLFNYVKTGACTGGSTLLDNLDLMKNKGICLWSQLPYTSGTCDVADAAAHDVEAADYRIIDYFTVSFLDRAAVKAALANNKALCVFVGVDSAFYTAGPGFIWNAATHAGTSLVGQHMAAIIGYDDSKNAYKLQNSWGTGWGTSGCIWVDYEFAETGLGTGTLGVGVNGITPTTPPTTPTLPVANAGYDISIPSTSEAVLSGTLSYDPDGYIKSYLWEQVSGPNTATLANSTAAVASASGLTVGQYVFKLTVTDNEDNTATDTVTVLAASTNKLEVTVTKKVTKGRVADTVRWTIVSDTPIVSAAIQSGTTGSLFNTIYNIVPFTNSGTYTSIPTLQKTTRYYRLRVAKADGTVSYSPSTYIR